jgi:hypothetical protein
MRFDARDPLIHHSLPRYSITSTFKSGASEYVGSIGEDGLEKDAIPRSRR